MIWRDVAQSGFPNFAVLGEVILMSGFLPKTYSRRTGLRSSGPRDVYQYDTFDERLRNQLWMIIKRGIGPYYVNGNHSQATAFYNFFVQMMQDEVGKLQLTSFSRNAEDELFRWFSEENESPFLIDFIELYCKIVNTEVRKELHRWRNIPPPDKTIGEINERMLEAGLGFQFVNNEIVKLSSQFLHHSITVPVLGLINDPVFSSVDQEYRKAYDFFRNNDYESSIIEACKAVESTFKILGAKRGWNITSSDTLTKLVAAAYSSNFIPNWMQSGLTPLRGLLEGSSGVLRNKMAAHGSGTQPRDVGHEICAFQIHQAGAVILFLIEHDKVTP
ncbi:MAG: hypothetical protein K2X00_16835 [Nitrospiraceae bacterium]|nr:hypothetical protein [Nitrospiraceae bacterium]